MATCANCRSEVAETDFFCWSCGKPWKGAAVGGTFEEQVYDEYARKMREEYVRDRKVRALTLLVLAFAAAAGAGWVGVAGSRYVPFGVAVLSLASVAAAVRAWANWRQHEEAKAKLEGRS